MFTIRNKKIALGFSARAGVAGLVPGQVVKMAIGSAAGEQPTAILPLAADYTGTTQLFLVDWYGDDSQVTDFTVDFVNNNVPLVPTAVIIPINEQVTLYRGVLVVAYSADVLPANLKAAREPSVMGYSSTTHLPLLTTPERVNGQVYRQDAPAEYTFTVQF